MKKLCILLEQFIILMHTLGLGKDFTNELKFDEIAQMEFQKYKITAQPIV